MNSTIITPRNVKGPSTGRGSFVLGLVLAGIAYFLAIAAPLLAIAYWHKNLGVWPATAVGIVAILRTPVRQQPWTVLVTATANATALLAFSPGPAIVIAGLVLVHVVEEWGLVVLMRRFVSPHVDFARTRDLIRFAVLSVWIWTPITALLGVAAYATAAPTDFALDWFTWWLPDAVWVLLLVPSFWFLVRLPSGIRQVSRRAIVEQTTFFALFAAALWWVLYPGNFIAERMPLGLVVVPFLVLAAARFGVGATTCAVALLASFSIAATYMGLGPFVRPATPSYVQLILAQLNAVGVGSASILLASVMHERAAAAARIRAFFRSTPGIIAVVDTDRRLVARTSESATVSEGVDDESAGDVAEDAPVIAGDHAAAWDRALAGESSAVALDLGPKGCFELNFHPLRDEQGVVVGAASVGVDVTRAEREAAQRQHALRFEALGRLAGGIAHDLNNLLTVVLGQLWLLDDGRGAAHPHAGDLATLQGAVDRMKALTQQLLAFARAQIISPRVIALGAQLEAIRPLLVRVIEERVRIVLAHADDLWHVNVDPSQFDQVVLNLCANARDAMPDGGVIEIGTANVRLDAKEGRHLLVAPGEYVCLSVADTGIGIPPESLSRIFEPFFSSKSTSKGTGLGLATVEGVVRQAGGAIEVTSVVGKGTRFNLYFPRADGPVAPEVAPPPATRPVRSDGTTILVCEDEAPVRQLVVRILSKHGYRVVEAGSADEALTIARDGAMTIDLLLSDVVMPGMDGPALAREVRLLRPTLPVLLVSGYTQDVPLAPRAQMVAMDLLAKPFSAEQLVGRVQRLLAGANPIQG